MTQHSMCQTGKLGDIPETGGFKTLRRENVQGGIDSTFTREPCLGIGTAAGVRS